MVANEEGIEVVRQEKYTPHVVIYSPDELLYVYEWQLADTGPEAINTYLLQQAHTHEITIFMTLNGIVRHMFYQGQNPEYEKKWEKKSQESDVLGGEWMFGVIIYTVGVLLPDMWQQKFFRQK